jgi:hypothetical protein
MNGTHIIHRGTILALVATSACLALTPVAHATPPDRQDGLGGANPTVHSMQAAPPDRIDRIGSAAPATGVIVTLAPDRSDKVGTNGFVTQSVPTVILRPAAGFNWTDAVIGAVAGLAIALIATAAYASRGRGLAARS